MATQYRPDEKERLSEKEEGRVALLSVCQRIENEKVTLCALTMLAVATHLRQAHLDRVCHFGSYPSEHLYIEQCGRGRDMSRQFRPLPLA